MKKILISLSIVIAVAALVIGATTAFFSDEETSTGNTFTAGALDLQIDSTCHYDGMVCTNTGTEDNPVYLWKEETTDSSTNPDLIDQHCACTWVQKDLATGDIFFKYDDIKPGDNGENTISIHVKDNDSWLCAYVENLVNKDNTCNEPEEAVDPSCPDENNLDGTGLGELQDNILITIWEDNYVNEDDGIVACDNIQQASENVLVNSLAIDSNEGVWPLYAPSVNAGAKLEGDTTVCLGVAWSVPSITGNIIQTDSITGDIRFYAEQWRNNSDFRCPVEEPTNGTID